MDIALSGDVNSSSKEKSLVVKSPMKKTKLAVQANGESNWIWRGHHFGLE